MKVILINGSPHEFGCTYTALAELERTLQEEGVETEMIHIGKEPVGGCLGCGYCYAKGKCVQQDMLNDVLEKVLAADGLVLGSPVHYAAIAGQASSFFDRLFFASGGRFANKLGTGVVSCRRGGASAAFDELNKYFTISNMPVEPGAWQYAERGKTGFGRYAEYACAGAEHGLAAEMY